MIGRDDPLRSLKYHSFLILSLLLVEQRITEKDVKRHPTLIDSIFTLFDLFILDIFTACCQPQLFLDIRSF